jgi:nicotinate-nucleotide pyrophosphorylase (carboxylating)
MEKYAVKMGGGHNHRKGLYDMVLIKDNHLKLISYCEIKKLIESVRRKISKNTQIEIEIDTLDALKKIYDCEADIIMLDNMSPAKIKKAVEWIKKHQAQPKSKKTILEASGGINLSNIKEIAKTGVDLISVGEITHSAPALDTSLEIIKVNNG